MRGFLFIFLYHSYFVCVSIRMHPYKYTQTPIIFYMYTCVGTLVCIQTMK